MTPHRTRKAVYPVGPRLSRRTLALSAGWDAGNRSMRESGRSVWSEEDLAAAAAEYERVYPEAYEREQP